MSTPAGAGTVTGGVRPTRHGVPRDRQPIDVEPAPTGWLGDTDDDLIDWTLALRRHGLAGTHALFSPS
jgi:hypothetical protein